MNQHKVVLEGFEGPLDLLLHLIQKNKLHIEEINIAEITEQYLTYLKQMESFNLEIASEFLLVAATLISIKVKMLLPNPINELTGEEEDPRKELIEMLLTYEKFKRVVPTFQQLLAEQDKSYFREKDFLLYNTLERDPNPLENVTVDLLSELATYALLRVREKKLPPYEVQRKKVTVSEKIALITKEVLRKQSLYFSDLNMLTRSDQVQSFLAILELYKDEFIYFIQEENFSPLKLLLREDA